MLDNIHKTAIIGEKVKLGNNVKVGAYCILEGDIEIGDGTVLHSNVVISGRYGKIKIGNNNTIYPFAVIGGEPQDDKFKGEESNIEIGDNNVIREYVTINSGSELGNEIEGTKNITKIGNNCWFYISSHIAHDVVVEDNVTIANCVGIAGHCKIGHHTIIGGLTGIHQFVNIGNNVMIGGKCGIDRDIPPFSIVESVPNRVTGANIIGLKRAGYSTDDIRLIRNFYNDITTKGNKVKDVIEKYKLIQNDSIEKIIDFLIRKGKRSWL